MTREEAYAHIAKVAAEHALIAQAFGGVITIVHPDAQRLHGIEANCLYMAGQGPHPAGDQAQTAARKEEQPDLFALPDAEQQEGAA
ncbi:hypothetical protein ACUTAF_01860 [Pseudomonas sp. SP16.1]|uniref:hypothetical protein n=1 Tax=Pseudomonas sp. SP16.1 TaxID=3458854 RepID=UPI0040456ABB